MPLYRPWIERQLWLLAPHLPGRRRKPVVRAGPFGRFAPGQAEPIEKTVDGAVNSICQQGISPRGAGDRLRAIASCSREALLQKLLQPSLSQMRALRARRNFRHIVRGSFPAPGPRARW